MERTNPYLQYKNYKPEQLNLELRRAITLFPDFDAIWEKDQADDSSFVDLSRLDEIENHLTQIKRSEVTKFLWKTLSALMFHAKTTLSFKHYLLLEFKNSIDNGLTYKPDRLGQVSFPSGHEIYSQRLRLENSFSGGIFGNDSEEIERINYQTAVRSQRADQKSSLQIATAFIEDPVFISLGETAVQAGKETRTRKLLMTDEEKRVQEKKERECDRWAEKYILDEKLRSFVVRGWRSDFIAKYGNEP